MPHLHRSPLGHGHTHTGGQGQSGGALSRLTKADTGRGFVAGICVAFIAIISDRLISAWSSRRKAELGLE